MNTITPGMPESLDIAKAQARRLASALKGNTSLSHGQSLELIAKLHGCESWGHLRAALSSETQSASSAPSLSARTKGSKDTVLFERSYAREIVHLFNYWHNRAMGEKLTQQQNHHLCHVLSCVDDDYSGVRYASERYFRNLTLGELLQAESKAIRSKISEGGNFSIAELASHLPKDPYSLPAPGVNSLAVKEAIKDLAKGFSEKTAYGFRNFLDRDVFDRKHSLVIGSELQRLEIAARGALSFARKSPVHPSELSKKWRISCPHTGFSTGFSALSWLVNVHFSHSYPSKGTPALEREAIPVIIRMSDLGTFTDRLDLFQAQARSMGIHLCIWIDSDNVEADQWSKITDNLGSLIDLRGEDIIVQSAKRRKIPVSA